MRSRRGSAVVVHVAHRRGDGGVDPGDVLVHGVRDRTVARVALAAGAQLDELHRLARVEVEHEADAVAEAERVGRGVLQPAAAQRLVGLGRALQPGAVRVADPDGVELLWHLGAEVRRERLPLNGQHPVALQVAERAVVGHDLEPVAQRLEAASRAVAAVGALAHEIGEERASRVVAEARDR